MSPVTPRPAATVLLLRDAPSFQVLLVQRHHQIDFASGAMVFPGGKAAAADADPAWEDVAVGWAELEPPERVARVAAVRETFEESGVLLAVGKDGRPWSGPALSIDVRSAVDKGRASFLEVVLAAGARLDLMALQPLSRWITPEPMPKRFDTRFFLAHAPANQAAVCDGAEAVDAVWIEPEAALQAWRDGHYRMLFPTRLHLMQLAAAGQVEAVMQMAASRPPPTVLPRIDEDGMLRIPEAAGYGVTEARLADER